jgi:hypothetical protein
LREQRSHYVLGVTRAQNICRDVDIQRFGDLF